jgi:hypothetical protein
MQNYSLLEVVYSKSDPIDIVDPTLRLQSLAEKFYRSAYGIHELDKFASLMCEGDLLFEFSLKEFVKDNISNVFQAGIGAALEGGISVGSLGAGAPVGVAAEAANDMMFFGMSVTGALSAVKGFANNIGELKDMYNEIKSISVKNTPQQIYDLTKKILSKITEVAKKAKVPVKKLIKKMQDLFRKLMAKIAKATGDMVAMFVPIPGADMIVQNAIVEFADDAFKTIVKLFEKLPKFLKDLMTDPPKMKSTFLSILDAGIGFVKKLIGKGDKKEKVSFLKGIVNNVKDVTTAIISPTTALLKHSGAGNKIIKFLESKGKKAIEMAVSAYVSLYPVIMGVGSALSILQNPKEIDIKL